MKKIIAGVRYDTDTAKLVASWYNGYSRNDFKFCAEDLYQTAKGAFFLHGDGGALSKYSQSYGSSTGGGETIIPLCKDEVITWLERTDNTDELETLFPEAIVDA